MTTFFIIAAIVSLLGLAYKGKSYYGAVLATFFAFVAWHSCGIENLFIYKTSVIIATGALFLFGFKPLRRIIVSAPIMKIVAGILPKIGETERIALEAGSVWFDGDLFSGKPNWKKLLSFKIQELTEEEQKFLDGPVEKLCKMLDDYQIAQDRDLSPEVWDFIKKKKFFGMIIPKEYGGLGFSAAAHSAVVTKVSSKSVTAAVTVMVPNSLGPGELLMSYGTQEQKNHYLNRLADGREIPCFGLTEPHAGSDAANGQSVGIVCKGKHKGKNVLGIKVTFNKRYITLAPIATVIGLAFNLKDPEGLIGDKKEIGITLALVPRDTKGMNIGRRHDPMGVPFQNGPMSGEEMFIPMDYVIGGQKYVGQGWRMLMEALSAGRGISLPSLSVGAAQTSIRAAGGYAIVREQFGVSINQFEGVQERLGRMAGHTYFMNAVRKLTCGAVDAGEHPSVVSAIAKAYLTESMRLLINDGMDIQGGAAICRGPRNIFSRPYYSIPVGITVEGANILTRSLIVFGQGAMRCHPFVLDEIHAIQEKDLAKFDTAFFGHLNHIYTNKVRAFLLAVTFGKLACSPVKGYTAKHFKQLTRFSSAFAFIADIALATLGGALKRKESLSGKFSDALGWMYIASATLKKFHDEGQQKDDRILLDWVMAKSFYEIENALYDILRNHPNKLIGCTVKLVVFPFGRRFDQPSDTQVLRVARAVTDVNSGIREMLTEDIHIPGKKEPGLGALEDTVEKVAEALHAKAKIAAARRKGVIQKAPVLDMAKEAKKKDIITAEELKHIKTYEKARDDIVQVNDFDPEEYKTLN